MIYCIVWLMFLFWYICVVISPNCFYNISEIVLEKEKISENSKLIFLYLNKKAFPKLRSIAIMTIILFFMNLFFTILWVIISYYIPDNSFLKYGEIIYVLLFLFVATIPIVKVNLIK